MIRRSAHRGEQERLCCLVVRGSVSEENTEPMMTRRRKWQFAALVVIVLCGLAGTLWPSSEWVPTPMNGLEMKCFSESTPVEWSFCINSIPGSASQDVLYHFHGRNGAATWWNDETYYSGEVQRFWSENGIAQPTVVSISFGHLWILTSAEDGLLQVFTEHVMPRVEAEIHHRIARRMLVGESMGGVNALVVALKTKGLFSKVAALCPPLPTVSPAASLRELLTSTRRTSTSWRRAAMMLWFSRQFYPTDAAWLDNNPVPVSERAEPLENVDFYVSCGARDDWGCQEGAELVVNNLKKRGSRVEWHLRPGGHCDIDSSSLARFLGASE